MVLADAIGAVFYLYVVLFTIALIVLLVGIRMLYRSFAGKDETQMRQAKFILLFAVIALLCIAVVSFFITGKLPVE